MVVNNLKPKEVLRKEPFKRIMPSEFLSPANIPQFNVNIMRDGQHFNTPADGTSFEILTQADFLREYYVSGHKINSRVYMPDIFKEIDGKQVIEVMPRCAFPFQYIITIKQLCHLCGNNVEFKLSNPKPTEKERNTLDAFTQGWISKNLEVAWYELARSEKITGDGAMCFYRHQGQSYWKTLSYLNGDTLFPHYNDITGKLDAFGRKYSAYNEKGKESEQFLEVWDEMFYYKFCQSKNGFKSTVNKVFEYFGLDNWELVGESKAHGYKQVPIVYKRSLDGACWSQSQSNIEAYELAVSQFAKNNEAFAFPILYILGEGDVKMSGASNGRPSAITSNSSDTKVGFAERNGAPEAFKLQLDILSENIFRGSFAVNPPEIRGGDMPGITVKLIYSPALEKAMDDANNWNATIDDMVSLFKYSYALDLGCSSDFAALDVRGEIIPYTHQNVAEVVANLVQLKMSGLVSAETASSQTTYGANGEYNRILQEEQDKIVGLKAEEPAPTHTTLTEQTELNDTNQKRKLIANAQK